MIGDNVKILFMDLDHTIIQPHNGARFPKNRDDWEIIEGTPFAIAKYFNDGYKPVIVSNQGGIKLGFSTAEDTHLKFKAVIEAICRINSMRPGDFMYFFCASNDKDNPYRKPNPGMASTVEALYDNVDLEHSIMVGDMDTDELFAKNAGIGIYINASELALMGLEK